MPLHELHQYETKANVGYKNMLYLDITGRTDWSSTLVNTDSNSFFYPSVGLTGILTEMFNMPESISFAKVRVSYAEVGKDAPAYSVYDTYTINTSFGSSALTSLPNTKNNENLLPERTSSIEAGLEMYFLQRRVGFDFAWYQTNSSDQIFNAQFSRATGFSSGVINSGDIQNTGVEVMLTGAPIVKDNFRWDYLEHFGVFLIFGILFGLWRRTLTTDKKKEILCQRLWH